MGSKLSIFRECHGAKAKDVGIRDDFNKAFVPVLSFQPTAVKRQLFSALSFESEGTLPSPYGDLDPHARREEYLEMEGEDLTENRPEASAKGSPPEVRATANASRQSPAS